MAEFNYLREKRRMLDSLGRKGKDCGFTTCEKCPLSQNNNDVDLVCTSFENQYPEEATAVVRKWAEEHPRRTRKDVLLEKFPKAIIAGGTPDYT